MSDVTVSIGTDLTPLQRGLAQAKANVQQFGSQTKATLGIGSGSTSDFRQEQRATRGIEQFTAALANAKDPISGFTQGLEGLARGFRLTGALFAGLAIGDFVREELTKAADATKDFYQKTDKIFAVSKDSSKAFASDAVKSFKEAEEAYGKEGFLQRLIYGQGLKRTIDLGAPIVREIQQQLNEYKAQLIDDQTATISAGSDPVKKEIAERKLVTDEYGEKIKNADSPEEKESLAKQQQAKLDDISKKAEVDDTERLRKHSQEVQDATKKQQDGQRALRDEEEKQQKILNDENDTTNDKRIASLQKDYEAKKLIAENTANELEKAKAVTAEYQAQSDLNKAIAQAAKDRARIQEEIANKEKTKKEAEGDLNEAIENASIFHGESSSLRKIGLGGSVSQNNGEASKQRAEALKKLDAVKTELSKLNENLQST